MKPIAERPIDLTAVTLAELRYAAALGEHRHFGRAARASGVSQPTLSAQIKKLERTLGVQLFERTSHAVEPTPIGAQVLAQTQRVLDETEAILGLVAAQSEPLAGPLRLGVIPTLGPYLLPWLVPPLARAFPRLKLVLRELKTEDLLAELGDHRLDAGILALPVRARGLAEVELFDEAFFVLAREDHPLAARTSVEPGDLEGERLLLLEEGHCLRDQALEVCGGRSTEDGVLDLESDFRATSLETLRHMVAAGMGVTLMPSLTLAGRTEDGTRAVPFAPGRPARRRMALCWRRTHPRGRDFELFARFVRENLPAGVSPTREPGGVTPA